MPQLDISTYSSQIFWLILCFTTLYYFASSVILPRIRDIIEDRKIAIESDVSSTKELEEEIETIKAKTKLLRQEATSQYQAKLEEASQEAATQREKLTQDAKDKIEKITTKSQDDLQKFIESTKSQSQKAAQDLAQNIKSKLFNI